MSYWIVRAVAFVFLKVFFGLKVEGQENIPRKSNFIVVANHASFLDALIIAVAIPEKIHWIAARGIYNTSWLKWIMGVSSSMPTGNSSVRAISLLTQNKNVGVFPEGTRTHNGSLGTFRRGAALLAVKTGRPIVPCAIFGTFEALPRHAYFPKLRKLKIKIGKSKFLSKEFDETVDDIYLQDGIFKVRNTIREMLHAG
ncbi:MAG: lysophospholipid acyltransferase family protein [Candidatus Omnitrophota bacterium]